jgi:nitroreductase
VVNNERIYSKMDVMSAVKARRSVGKMKPDVVPGREKIEKMLEAATYAPNHHEVEPWRFFVLAGNSRQELGELMAQRVSETMPDLTSDKAKAALEKARTRLFRAPVVIVVASVKPNSPKVVDVENVEAVSAAIQNMLLVAQAEGLATMWRTGDVCYDPQIKAFFGLEPEEHLVGFVYVGYPAVPVSDRQPTPFSEKTRWLGFEG